MDDSEIKVRVAVRIRPLLGLERGEEECVRCEQLEDSAVIIMGLGKQFAFDFAFPKEARQDEVFQVTAQPLVDMCFRGYNATLLAYGQTGSGKTFTMGTGNLMGVLNDQLGIVPRVAKRMFALVEESANKRTFKVSASFVELYNEEVKDLLDPEPKHIAIREDKQEGIVMVGATEKCINGFDDFMSVLELGSMSRTTHSTNMNEVSSRSHAIFTCRLEQYTNEEVQAGASDVEGLEGTSADDTLTSKFHFVDLAGSERVKRSGAEGERLKEGISINSGLLALGNVISALGDPERKATHVPYRDSRLTRLLQDSLGGNSRTLMIACVSPAESNFNETLNTLRYANRARNIKNRAVINRDPTGVLIANLRKEVAELKRQLRVYKGEEDGPLVSLEDVTKLEETRAALKKANEENAVLRAEVAKVTYERDCFALKLQSQVAEEEKDTVLIAAKHEFKNQVRRASNEGPGNGGLGSVVPGVNGRDGHSQQQEALETKVLMMKTIMTREQQKRLAKMEEASKNIAPLPPPPPPPLPPSPPMASPRSRSGVKVPRLFDPRRDSIQEDEEFSLSPGPTPVRLSSDIDAVFDNADVLEQDQLDRQLQVKFMDNHYSALSSNINTRNKVVKSYQQKITRFDGEMHNLSRQMSFDQTQIESTNHEIAELDRKLGGHLDEQQRIEFTEKKERLQSKLDELHRRLSHAEMEKKKLLKLKAESDRKVEQLQSEVRMMKDDRTALSRRMKAEAMEWKKFRMEQRKEIAKLQQKLQRISEQKSQLEQSNKTLQRNTTLQRNQPSRRSSLTEQSKSARQSQEPGRRHSTSKSRLHAIAAGASALKSGALGSFSSSFSPSPVVPAGGAQGGGRNATTLGVGSSGTRRSSASASSKVRSSASGSRIKVSPRDKLLKLKSTPRGRAHERHRNPLDAFTKWLSVGFPAYVEDRTLQRELEQQEEVCEDLEDKMYLLREGMQLRRAQGFEVDLELEDKLDTIQAEVDYRRAKIDESREFLANAEAPFSFDDMSAPDLCAVAQILTEELAESSISSQEQRGEIERLCEELGQTQHALTQLEGRIPLQELKMQQMKAELDAEHEQQLWFFMNQIERLKQHLQRNEGAGGGGGGGGGSGITPPEEQSAEEREMWTVMNDMERLREQRYEDLLARNDYLEKRSAEQLNLRVKYTEAREELERTALVLSSVIPQLEKVSHMSLVLGEIKKEEEPDRGQRHSVSSSGSIFERLSKAENFTGMYKHIHDDMHIRGVGHLGGSKVERKLKKPKCVVKDKYMEDEGKLQGHLGAVHCLAIGPDRVYTGSIDRTVMQWDVQIQKPTLTLSEHKSSVRKVIVHQNIVISSSEDKTIRIWDVRQSKMIRCIDSDPIAHALVFASDGQHFYSGHEDGSTEIWDMARLDKPLNVARKHTGSVVALIRTDNYIASGSRDRTICLYKPKDMSHMDTLIHHHDSVTCFATVLGNLVSGSRDRQIKEYKQDESGKDVGECIFAAHTDWVNALAPSPDQKFLFSASKDTTIKIWDTTSWDCKSHIMKHDHVVHDLAWFQNKFLISASNGGFCLLQRFKKR